MENPGPPPCCELCGRHMDGLTRHHLIPRTRHHNRRVKRDHSREELQGKLLWVCRPCHDQIHAVLSEKQLADHFYNRDALLNHPDIERFVRWIASKPAGFTPRSRVRRR